MCDYSMAHTLFALLVGAVVVVGGPLTILWKDNKGER